MDVVVDAAIDDVLGLVLFPHIAERIAGSGWGTRLGAERAAVLPFGTRSSLS